MTVSRTVLFSAVVNVGMVGCGELATPVQPSNWESGDGYRSRALAVAGRGTGFVEVRPGIEFQNMLSDAAIVENRHRMNGSGVAVGDVNGDGNPDIVFAAMESPARLFLNYGNWEFVDATVQAGLGNMPRWSTGVVFADVDGDGDLDLFVTAQTDTNRLYLNDGTGHFEESPGAGLGSVRGSMTAAFADTDGDGDLDLYVANYKRIALRDSLSPDRLLFDSITGPDGAVLPELTDHLRVRQSGTRQMRLELGEEDQYYLNGGGGRFHAAPIPGVDRDWGMTARLQDVSGDGIPDLYVANDFESPDYFLLGDGTGGWKDGAQGLAHTSNSSMSVDVADVNRDGVMDIFVPDMLSDDPFRSRIEVGTAAPLTLEAGDLDTRPQYMQNTLHLGRGDGSFAEVAWAYGVAASEWSWSGVFLDVDLDGWEDLLVSTGHSFDVQDGDAQVREREAIRRVRSVREFRALITEYPRLPLRNRAFRNEGGDGFAAVEQAWGFGSEVDITHGLALGDFDGDGDLDVVTNRLNQPAGLFKNESRAPRIAVRLRGSDGNTHGIGALVTIEGGGITQTREMVAGGLYLSGSETMLSFAALSDTMRVTVAWRSGRSQVILQARPNRLYEVREIDSPVVGSLQEDKQAMETDPSPMLSAEPLGVGQRRDAGFQGRQLQSLVPHGLSREGPPVAVGDLSNDGSEYVVIGAYRGTSPQVFQSEDGRLLPVRDLRLPVSRGDWTGVIISQGLLIAAISGYGTEDRTSWVASYRLESGAMVEVQRIVLGQAAPGPIAGGDIDGDGDDDVFVGIRFLPGRYPESAPSLILTREADRLEVSASLQLGMVTGAAFADADADGDLDLAVSTEWGTIRLLENESRGVFQDRTVEWGMANTAGMWRGIAWGDVNQDDRPDLVATNWGWNSRLGRIGSPESRGESLRLYYADFDADGSPDPMVTEYREDLDGWSPIAGLIQLRRALPQLNRRISSFHAYASSTVADLLPADSPYLEVSTLASSAWINTGGGFEKADLPASAQQTAGNAVKFMDVSGDGRSEIIIAQNFFPVDQMMRQDAGRGLILTYANGDGDGDGNGNGNGIGYGDGDWAVHDLGVFADQRSLARWSGGLIMTADGGPAYVLRSAWSGPDPP